MMAPTMTKKQIVDFVIESNRIEGIEGATGGEVIAFEHFIGLDTLYLGDVLNLLNRFAPGHLIRTGVGQDVYVGNYKAPAGGPNIMLTLAEIIGRVEMWKQGLAHASPLNVHRDFEKLHPFTDGNGRVGRAIWAWQMLHALPGTRELRVGLSLGFLHEFYYQTLSVTPGRMV
jgi:hypothetical protein